MVTVTVTYDEPFFKCASHFSMRPYITGRFSPVAKCSGHSTTVAALDWSQDNRVLRSTCANLEVLHWNMPSGKPVSADVRDLGWFTHNSTAGPYTVHPFSTLILSAFRGTQRQRLKLS